MKLTFNFFCFRSSDYSCAFYRDILVHGRLYLSQSWLCFYANIFGWETLVCLYFYLLKPISRAANLFAQIHFSPTLLLLVFADCVILSENKKPCLRKIRFAGKKRKNSLCLVYRTFRWAFLICHGSSRKSLIWKIKWNRLQYSPCTIREVLLFFIIVVRSL